MTGAGDATVTGAGRVAMTTPTIIPMITNITITITATGGPPFGAVTAGAVTAGAGAAGAGPPPRLRELKFKLIYNLNSEINSSKFL